MKYPCENCKLRAAYDKNPKSLIGRFWRWQQEEFRKKYDFWKYQ